MSSHIKDSTKLASTDSSCTMYRDRVTTTNATPVVVRSVPMQANSRLFIDTITQFVMSNYLLGGYSWDTLGFGRSGNSVPAAFGTLDTLQSRSSGISGPSVSFIVNSGTNSIDITVNGKAGTTILWSVQTKMDWG